MSGVMQVETTLDSLAGKEFKEALAVADAIFEDQGKGLRGPGPLKLTVTVVIGRNKEDEYSVVAEAELKVPKYKAKGVITYRSQGSDTGWAHSESDQPELPFTRPAEQPTGH